MKLYLIVAFGSGLGGMLRYYISDFVQKNSSSLFPYGTLTVNIIGSFIIGLILFYLDSIKLISAEMRVFLTVGLCGGLTTFSTFSFETVKLIQDSEYLLAGTNVLLNVFMTLLAVLLAAFISKLIIGG
ncbi:MAG: fluoride efflux transporter CrcB [Ignavibacteriaceae bacterium]|jgi:CrcB protein|nr:fluoride efflux transporter CrcB [Ignavibacteriaceae bacterium]